LTARKDVTISTVRDWTIITDTKNLTVWSFAPIGATNLLPATASLCWNLLIPASVRCRIGVDRADDERIGRIVLIAADAYLPGAKLNLTVAYH
jgi:hypothetical protein